MQANQTATREPQKLDSEKRNPSDQFFDSIVCSPGRERLLFLTLPLIKNKFVAGKNEFVIFNNDQCVPLYAVKYVGRANNSSRAFDQVAVQQYQEARRTLPPFAFFDTHHVQRSTSRSWPFHFHTFSSSSEN